MLLFKLFFHAPKVAWCAIPAFDLFSGIPCSGGIDG